MKFIMKANQKRNITARFILAVALLASLNLSALGDTTNLISLTTFDEGGLPVFTYPYSYSWGYADPGPNGANSVSTYAQPPDLTTYDLMFIFDGTDYSPVPSGGAYGFGFGGGLNWGWDPSVFISTNLEDYIFSFDGRVEGLLPAASTADGEVQVRFDADTTMLLQINKTYGFGSNWTHYAFTLDQGAIGGGTLADFVNNLSAITQPRFAVNFHLPDSAFGFDADNAVHVDNLKLEVAQKTVLPPPAPTVEFVISDWNFDDKPAKDNYEYTYAGPGSWADFTAHSEFAVHPSGNGTSNLVLTFDNSTFASGTYATLQWAGAGTGCGGPLNAALFNTPQLALYKLYFDAKVEGLAPAKTSSGAEMQFAIRTNAHTVLSKNFTVSLKTNWQTFSFTLDKGSVGDGSVAAFQQNLAVIDGVQPNFQVTGAMGDYATDNDNVVLLDNIKLVRLVVACPPLTIGVVTNHVIVTWEASANGTAKLQSANSIGGAFSDVSGAISPYIIPLAGAPRYFRTQWVPQP